MSNDDLSPAEEQAFQLSQCAILLDEARQQRADLALLAVALERNMETWIALKTLVNAADNSLPEAIKVNMRQLAEFVIERTLLGVESVTDSTLDTLINVNLQISEGLLEGAKKG